ncbi:hypothetical protein [Actinoplanes sp. NPDC026670]|uniref:hypothetical protein n=1 Tax=Actinoplanes sp. NPDC026670 TaxID=3154700 RepID=UPI0033DF2FA6
MRQRAITALNALGDDAEKIGQTLFNGGWLGQPLDSGGCPIARYLTTVLPDVVGVAVGNDEVTVFPIDGPDVDVTLPLAVAGFVAAFDVDAFPELIDQAGTVSVPDI